MEVGLVYTHPEYEDYILVYSVIEKVKTITVLANMVDRESYEARVGALKELQIAKKDLAQWTEVGAKKAKKAKK